MRSSIFRKTGLVEQLIILDARWEHSAHKAKLFVFHWYKANLGGLESDVNERTQTVAAETHLTYWLSDGAPDSGDIGLNEVLPFYSLFT